MWVRNGMTLGTKWYDLGMKWYGLGYEMVWDESAWVRNDLIPVGWGGGGGGGWGGGGTW